MMVFSMDEEILIPLTKISPNTINNYIQNYFQSHPITGLRKTVSAIASVPQPKSINVNKSNGFPMKVLDFFVVGSGTSITKIRGFDPHMSYTALVVEDHAPATARTVTKNATILPAISTLVELVP